jgi:hypothetical protein
MQQHRVQCTAASKLPALHTHAVHASSAAVQAASTAATATLVKKHYVKFPSHVAHYTSCCAAPKHTVKVPHAAAPQLMLIRYEQQHLWALTDLQTPAAR